MNNKKFLVKNILLVLLGSIFYGLGISLFLSPNNLAPGGVSGISIMINNFLPIGVGLISFIINVPLMLIGFIKLGKNFLGGTLFAIFTSSFFTDLFANLINPITHDKLLAAVFGGVVLAIGIGLVFKAGCTTGGTDVIVRLIKLRHRHLKTGSIFLLVDGFISIASGVVFKDSNLALFALISLVTNSIVLDIVLYGNDEAKLVYIITNKKKLVTDFIINELDISASIIHAEGAYSNNEKNIIMCAIKKRELPSLQEFVLKTDTDSFMIVTSANEIYGEGFKLKLNNY